MKRSLMLALTLAALSAPLAAYALPVVGDIVGTNPKDATAALETAGCKVSSFEAEDGKIEAKCTDAATNKMMEIYIDPKTGAIVDMKTDD